MAFRATNTIPIDAYTVTKRAAVQLRINLIAFKAQLSASGATYDFLRDIYRTLERANNQFDALKTTPGLAAYAQAQESDGTYDVAGEFATMQAAIDAATGWMDSNVPTSVTAKAPASWGDGSLIATSFTPTQTAGLQTALQGVIDTIS